jgi:hypothetical protein
VGTNDSPRCFFPADTVANIKIMGAAVGNIIATIMATQATRNRGMVNPIAGPAPPVMPDWRRTTTHDIAASVKSDARMRLR